jgi:hypothetical protein
VTVHPYCAHDEGETCHCATELKRDKPTAHYQESPQAYANRLARQRKLRAERRAS